MKIGTFSFKTAPWAVYSAHAVEGGAVLTYLFHRITLSQAEFDGALKMEYLQRRS